MSSSEEDENLIKLPQKNSEEEKKEHKARAFDNKFEITVCFEKIILKIKVKDSHLEIILSLYRPKLFSYTEQLIINENILKLNNTTTVGFYCVIDGLVSFMSYVLYPQIKREYIDGVVYDALYKSVSHIVKIAKKKSEKLPKFNILNEKLKINSVKIIDEFIKALDDESFHGILDIEHVFKSTKGVMKYYIHDKNGLESLVSAIQAFELSKKLLRTKFNSNEEINFDPVLKRFSERLKNLEKFKIYFKKLPKKSIVRNENYINSELSKNQFPIKLGFNQIKKYLTSENEKTDVLMFDHLKNKINILLLRNNTGNLKNYFRAHCEISLSWFENPDLANEGFKIGNGGFGEVFKNKYCNSKVAIKFELPSRLSKSSGKQFFKEFYISKKVNHKNVLRILGFVKFETRLGIVMEYCGHGTLSDILKKNLCKKYEDYKANCPNQKYSDSDKKTFDYFKLYGEFDFTKRLQLAIDLGYGICALHQKNIIHFDIKPQNIYLRKYYHIVLADFGLAKEIKDGKEIKANGCSIYYCPPEQISNKNPSFKCDVWAYGMVVYYMLLSKHPFSYLKKINAKNMKDKNVYLRQISVELKRPIFPKNFEENNSELCEILRECWNVDPENRPDMSKLVKSLSIYFENYKINREYSS